MMRPTRRLVLLGLPALGLLAAVPGAGPGELQAQVPEAVRPAPGGTGWVGISVEMRNALDEEGRRRTLVRITDVRADGPAGQAGLRAGDVLLTLNGHAPEEGFVEMVGSLEPGDPVTVEVRRNGEARSFRFRAGERPRALAGPSTYSVLVQADTLAERMYRAMDSLRIRIGSLPRGVSALRIARGPVHLRFPGEDSLAADPATGVRPLPRIVAERQNARVLEEVRARLRPLAPYALGQSRAAGAEVVELEPQLAEYFSVERGVLVVSVAPGTPAALAGVRPGDVLTRIGSVAVGSVGDVRASLAQPRDSLPVTLIRKGERLELLLRR